MTAPSVSTVPEANLAVVTGEVRRAARRARERREERGRHAYVANVLLLRAASTWTGDERITVDGERALVVPAATVLAVLDALSRPREPGEYLVVLTPCDGTELGESVLARAMGRQVRAINRWDLVAEGFGVKRLDPRLYAEGWLAEALLDAQPPEGWRSPGPVLLYDEAMRALCEVRLGNGAIDAAALLTWTRDDTAVARFTALRETERQGIAQWLENGIGAVAHIVFRLYAHGHVTDAMPFGLALIPLLDPVDENRTETAIRARGRAEERYFGGEGPSTAALRTFAEAVQSQVLRWQGSGRAEDATLVVERAERLLAGLDATALAAASPILDTGLDARLTGLADAISAVLPRPAARDLDDVEDRLKKLCDHRRQGRRSGEVQAARAAVRLTRWLTTGEPEPRTVAAGVRRHLRDWSWADRALALLWNPDTSRVPRVADVYARLTETVRARRAALDEAFANRLAAWTESGATGDGLLLIEDVLERVVRPVAERKAPLIVVLDGMSAADGHALAEEIVGTGAWTEYARRGWEREAALTVIPSITRYGRTSLLNGTLTGGGQAEESAGFAAFWRNRKTRLFHKATLAAGAGARLHADVLTAVDEKSTIVAVVLNTIDEALDHGRGGDDHRWRLDDIRYLSDLLAAARAAGRPVILTSDHGHVLDHGDTKLTERAEAARYRTGAATDGEVLVRGPRVLAHPRPAGGEGEPGVVVPWSERVRYVPRKAGYHGGVSAAEMVVPVIVLAPSGDARMPQGWSDLDPRQHAPDWWDTPATAAVQDGADLPATGPRETYKHAFIVPSAEARSATGPRKARKPAAVQDEALFDAAPLAESAPEPAPTLGWRVAESELMRSQRQAVRNAPPADETAALIDGLARANGQVSVTSAAKLVDKPPARMAGHVALTARLLNVDGYPVIGMADGGRTVKLDLPLLREQFLGEAG